MNSDLERPSLEQLSWVYSPNFGFRELIEDALTHTSQLPTLNETLRFPCVQQLDSTTPKFVKHDEDINLRGISIYIANPNVIILTIHVGLKLFFLLYVQVHSPIICLSHNISTLFYKND